MPKLKYQSCNFRKATLDIITKANEIIADYQGQGFNLTLRQLYYQFVARGIIANNEKQYNKLGNTISDARLAGLIDWNAIVDRTRPNRGNPHWENPQEIVMSCAGQFKLDTRSTQHTYIEVWIEKDALLGILEQVCKDLDVPYLSCRGYVSQSSMREASQRFIEEEDKGKDTVLIHLGDHDPSGIDMSRDIQDRLSMFGSECHIERIALTMAQILEYNPPPNPAKITDSRFEKYRDENGDESWELDALDPNVITELIRDAVGNYTDEDKRQKLIKAQNLNRKQLQKIADNWQSVVKFMRTI